MRNDEQYRETLATSRFLNEATIIYKDSVHNITKLGEIHKLFRLTDNKIIFMVKLYEITDKDTLLDLNLENYTTEEISITEDTPTFLLKRCTKSNDKNISFLLHRYNLSYYDELDLAIKEMKSINNISIISNEEFQKLTKKAS